MICYNLFVKESRSTLSGVPFPVSTALARGVDVIYYDFQDFYGNAVKVFFLYVDFLRKNLFYGGITIERTQQKKRGNHLRA